MKLISNLRSCNIRLFRGWKLFQSSISWILIVFTLVLLFSLSSCATTRNATYERQRAGLLMLEGEHIYKNKGFYHSKESYKRRRKAMRANKKHYRR
jgi:hypothetical protein